MGRCDGGNPKGNVWLCGIEYAGITEDLPFDSIEIPPYVGVPCRDRNEFLRKYQYNWRAIKLLAALAGDDPSNYEDFFEKQSCFDQQSGYFKLNLFPFGFPDTSHKQWPEWLTQKTGFKTKQEYLDWCRLHRFPALQNWVSKHCPELIICTGITHTNDFRKAFGDGCEIVATTQADGKEIRYFVTNAGKTLIAIVYFLGGRYGLNSNKKLSATGKKLAELLKHKAKS